MLRVFGSHPQKRQFSMQFPYLYTSGKTDAFAETLKDMQLHYPVVFSVSTNFIEHTLWR